MKSNWIVFQKKFKKNIAHSDKLRSITITLRSSSSKPASYYLIYRHICNELVEKAFENRADTGLDISSEQVESKNILQNTICSAVLVPRGFGGNFLFSFFLFHFLLLPDVCVAFSDIYHRICCYSPHVCWYNPVARVPQYNTNVSEDWNGTPANINAETTLGSEVQFDLQSLHWNNAHYIFGKCLSSLSAALPQIIRGLYCLKSSPISSHTQIQNLMHSWKDWSCLPGSLLGNW